MKKQEKSRPKEEPQEPGEGTEACEEEVNKLQQELDTVRKEKEELFDRLQRVYADYANFQKRVPKNIADTVAYEREKLIKSLLPALDNFEHTLQKVSSAESVKAVVEGVRIIYDQLLNILKSHGVEQTHVLGDKFDPERHEAMMRRAEPDKPDNVVLEEFQKGYTVNGRVLRPSRVVVNKVPAEPQGVEGVSPSDRGQDARDTGTDAAQTASERESDTE
jgi:molecular chaperone GrpE